MTSNEQNAAMTFLRKVLIVFAVFSIGILLLLLVHSTIQILLILFASILFGSFLLGLSRLLASKINISQKICVWIVILFLLSIHGAMYYLIGSRVISETPKLFDSLKKSTMDVKASINTSETGKKLLNQLPGSDEMFQRANEKKMLTKLFSIFSSTLGIIANTFIFIALSLFIASNPQSYVEGIKKFFPPKNRDRVDEVLTRLSSTLFKWLTGRIIDMILLGIATGIGLWILGIPMALTLGVLTAILSFIPNIGPFLAAIAPVLIALTIGTDKVLYVIILFIVIQILESYLLTPFIQKRAVEVPPVVLLVGQVIFTVLAGGLGLLLATPLIACIQVLVNMLYIEGFIEKKF